MAPQEDRREAVHVRNNIARSATCQEGEGASPHREASHSDRKRQGVWQSGCGWCSYIAQFSGSQSGVIPIHLGDDPHELLERFLQTYGVHCDSRFAEAVVERVERQLVAAKTSALLGPLSASADAHGAATGVSASVASAQDRESAGQPSPWGQFQDSALSVGSGAPQFSSGDDQSAGVPSTDGQSVDSRTDAADERGDVASSHGGGGSLGGGDVQQEAVPAGSPDPSESPAGSPAPDVSHDDDAVTRLLRDADTTQAEVVAGLQSKPLPQVMEPTAASQPLPASGTGSKHKSEVPRTQPPKPERRPSPTASDTASSDGDSPRSESGHLTARQAALLAMTLARVNGVQAPSATRVADRAAQPSAAPSVAKHRPSAPPVTARQRLMALRRGAGSTVATASPTPVTTATRVPQPSKAPPAVPRPGPAVPTPRPAAMAARPTHDAANGRPVGGPPASTGRQRGPGVRAPDAQPAAVRHQPPLPRLSTAPRSSTPPAVPVQPASRAGSVASTRSGSPHSDGASETSSSGAAVLFNLDVRLGRGGDMGRIAVRRGDRVGDLAAAFVAKHKLPESATPRLLKLLLQNIRIHRERQQERQFR